MTTQTRQPHRDPAMLFPLRLYAGLGLALIAALAGANVFPDGGDGIEEALNFVSFLSFIAIVASIAALLLSTVMVWLFQDGS